MSLSPDFSFPRSWPQEGYEGIRSPLEVAEDAANRVHMALQWWSLYGPRHVEALPGVATDEVESGIIEMLSAYGYAGRIDSQLKGGVQGFAQLEQDLHTALKGVFATPGVIEAALTTVCLPQWDHAVEAWYNQAGVEDDALTAHRCAQQVVGALDDWNLAVESIRKLQAEMPELSEREEIDEFDAELIYRTVQLLRRGVWALLPCKRWVAAVTSAFPVEPNFWFDPEGTIFSDIVIAMLEAEMQPELPPEWREALRAEKE